jgi:argininosuccinate lyase
MVESNKKLWGGRFTLPTSRIVEEFTASIQFDAQLYAEDISGSIAHARMLSAQAIISGSDAEKIIAGLLQIKQEIENGSFEFKVELEDIHMNIEARLAEIIGSDIAGRLHTGRSRNDQVALDLRLYMRRHILRTMSLLLSLLKVLRAQAKSNINVIMPGFTHLQQAQPILFSHHLLAYVEMIRRDFQRFEELYKRVNISPLGSGALAGSSFPLDRQQVAEELQFAAITANSLDAVSDRDAASEFIFYASLLMVHLSRFCEELILWSTVQFDFVELSDDYCTGSSIMPQKKNPDVPELIRGKTGRVFGDLISILTMLKALPLAYNKDMQEDKEPLFDAVDTIEKSLFIVTGMIEKIELKSDNLSRFAGSRFSTATEVADYLVRKGMPFRKAHGVVGRIVAHCESEKLTFVDLSLDDWRKFSDLFEDDIFTMISPSASIEAKNLYGGTATSQVLLQIQKVGEFIAQKEQQLDSVSSID